MSTDIRAVQRRLISLGYDVGPWGADGIAGAMTRRAVARFQADRGLSIKWPGTIGPKTLEALFGGDAGPPAVSLTAPWYAEATRRLGLHETRNRVELAEWLRSDGNTLGDPSRLPWCGDFVETAIGLTLPDEPLPANPYLARNWMRFGRPLDTPAVGAIAVFWRGSKSGTSGHVGFVRAVRPDGALLIRGGNQSDAVTDAWLARDRLLGLRWPVTFDLPTAPAPLVRSSAELSTNEA